MKKYFVLAITMLFCNISQSAVYMIDFKCDQDAYKVFASIPASAGMVHLFENLMELNGQPKFNMVSETQFQERISKEDLNAAMKDERYWKNGGDPSYIAKVRAMSREVAREKAQ